MPKEPIIGIIAEYNPFHNGHAHQLASIRQLHPNSKIIAVISGSFTQRGETAILDKWNRAKAAVLNGANLVLELPTCYAVRSAQEFARGGVRLLNSLGIVDYLAFGTEYADTADSSGAFLLKKISDYLNTSEAQNNIHAALESGVSYGEAVESAIIAHCTADDIADADTLKKIVREPNTILALEYMRALSATGSTMAPLPIKRIGSSHNDSNISTIIGLAENIASGTAIRQQLSQPSVDWDKLKSVVPASTFELLQDAYSDNTTQTDGILYSLLLYKINQLHLEDLQSIYTVNEGLENRLLTSLKKAANLQELIASIATRRYPLTRIQRLIFYILMDMKKPQITELDNMVPQYARVLAFDEVGQSLLKEIKLASPIPIITKVANHITTLDILNNKPMTDLQKMLLLDIQATNLQALCTDSMALNRDFTTSPVRVKSDR